MLMFMCADPTIFFHVTFCKNTFRKKNLKTMNVSGNMRLGLRKILSSHEELQDLAFHN